MKSKIKKEKEYRRRKRVRVKIMGTNKIPRLCVFRAAKHIYSQLIDDEKGKILLSAGDLELAKKNKNTKNPPEKKKENSKIAMAYEIGKLIAKKALEKKIEKVSFDRKSYKYHGRVKALAEGAREGGLKF